MSETIGIIVIITIFILGASIFVSKLIIKTKEKSFRQSCDYTACEKYCEVERRLRIAINDSTEVRQSRNKDINNLVNQFKKND